MTKEQFQHIVFPLKDPIYRVALRLLRSNMEAEDVTQDVLIRLWLKKDELAQKSSLEAFAITMVKNLCLDRLKAHSRKVVELLPSDPLLDQGTPHQYAEQEDHKVLVQKAMKGLTDQQKLIVQLKEIEGYDYEEIKQVTGMEVNAIRVNLSRARKKIKVVLTKAFNHGLQRN